MVTLTIPHQIRSKLGANDTVDYDKFVVSPFTFNPVDQLINASIRITSSTNPSMTPVIGSLIINVASSTLEIGVQQLDFYRRIILSSAQNNAILTIIRDAQNSIESGLITLGLVEGIQSSGV